MPNPFDYIKNAGIDKRTSIFNNPNNQEQAQPQTAQGPEMQGPGSKNTIRDQDEGLEWEPLPFDRWMSQQEQAAPIGPQGDDYWWEMYLDYIASGGERKF